MRSIQNFRLWTAAVALALICSGGTARADVSWEHSATIRTSHFQQPLARFKIYNNWTPQRHRLLLKYAVSGGQLPVPDGNPFSMSALAPLSTENAAVSYHYGAAGWIQRLDDDRLLAYTSEMRSYISEPRRALLKRLRFNPWKKEAPELARKEPPSLTLEQRQRLGAEVRAVTKPLLKNVWKTYFRPLPKTRTFEGTKGRGFRMTWLLNADGLEASEAQWVRIAFEWWLAPQMAGDETVREFWHAARQSTQDMAWPSTSMWINETLPVLWQTMPEELHRAAATVMPPATSPRAGFGGTPLRFYVTVTLPPLQQMQVGDVRMEAALTGHHVRELRPAVFEAPPEYERLPLEPQLRKYENMIEGQIARREDRSMEDADALGFTWQAWNEYARATQSALSFVVR